VIEERTRSLDGVPANPPPTEPSNA
jgi:hypothetical protein